MTLHLHEIAYIDQLRNTHEETPECAEFGCVIHAPTDHHLRGMALHWRADRGLMERICEHGVGHPDPDHLTWYFRTHPKSMGGEAVHGCDGCCMSLESQIIDIKSRIDYLKIQRRQVGAQITALEEALVKLSDKE